jgi:nucleotide-binding universal stress UspA family protein
VETTNDVIVSGESKQSSIVVGVDGSEPSLRALRWAADHAHLTGAALEVVTAWTFPEQPAPLGLEIRVPFQEELMKEAEQKLVQIIADVLPEVRKCLPTHKVVRGNAAQVLLAEADHATLLVIGKRGHAVFEKLLMGSVSERCARGAPCPVVIVP